MCRVFARPNGEAAKCNASFKNRDALRGSAGSAGNMMPKLGPSDLIEFQSFCISLILGFLCQCQGCLLVPIQL